MQKLYAFIGSIQHYAAIARETLRMEKEAPAALKRKRQELEFLPAVLEVVDSPPSPLGRWILFTIMVFFIIAVTWSIVGKVDIVATAQGKIIPSGKVKVIQPLETGIVRAIHVRDGQMVKAGDVLIELNPTGAGADETRLLRELVTAQVNIARLEALLYDDPMDIFFPPLNAPVDLVARSRRHLESALAERNARLDAIDNEVLQRRAEMRTTNVEISRLKMILPNVRERVEKRRELLAKGYTARLVFLELEQELIDTEQQLLAIHTEGGVVNDHRTRRWQHRDRSHGAEQRHRFRARGPRSRDQNRKLPLHQIRHPARRRQNRITRCGAGRKPRLDLSGPFYAAGNTNAGRQQIRHPHPRHVRHGRNQNRKTPYDPIPAGPAAGISG